MTSLVERYRPACWQEVCGQDKAVSMLRSFAQRGILSGRAFWISGKSGQGKTTIARLIAHEVADAFSIEELSATSLTVAKLGQIVESSRYLGWGEKRGKAFIVNEAHGLRKDVIRELLTLIDPPAAHVVWVFTTTLDGQDKLFDDYDDAGPLLSRCTRVQLAQRAGPAIAKRVKEIAQREGLDGRPDSAYAKLLEETKGNMRAMIQAVESGCMLAGKDGAE